MPVPSDGCVGELFTGTYDIHYVPDQVASVVAYVS